MRLWHNSLGRQVRAEKIGRWDLLDPHVVTTFGEVVSIQPGFWDKGYDRGNSYAVLNPPTAEWPVMMPAAVFEATYTLGP